MLIQIKIIFSFMNHIINMRKEYLWDCLLPGQYSRTRQNLEGKFIKSCSKSKALIHYPMEFPRRQYTPALFIDFILPTLYGSGRSLWEPLMVLTELYASSHPLWTLPWNPWCSRDAGISNDDSQMVHRLVSGVLKLGLDGHHGNGEGDGAQPQPIHWSINDSLKNSHTVRVKCDGAPSCWNDTCYIVAWLWYNIIPHLINLTPLTVPSKKYGPMIQPAVTPAHHHVWWGVLHLKHVTRILFCPKKHCDPGCWLIAVVTCALPHRVVKSCTVMPSHKMQIYWNKSINKSGIWLLRYLVDV